MLRTKRTPHEAFIGPPNLTKTCKIHGILAGQDILISPRKLKNRIGFKPRCKQCSRDNQNKRTYEQVKNKTLKEKYGITLDQFNDLVEKHGNRCAICKKIPESLNRWNKHDPKRKKYQELHVDHDHSNNKIRGLLCNRCNRGIGLFLDNSDYIRAAADYVDKYHKGDVSPSVTS